MLRTLDMEFNRGNKTLIQTNGKNLKNLRGFLLGTIAAWALYRVISPHLRMMLLELPEDRGPMATPGNSDDAKFLQFLEGDTVVNSPLEKRFADGTRDEVEEASWESFPASDPPAWQ